MSANQLTDEDLIVRAYLPRDLTDVGRIYSSLNRESKVLSHGGSYICSFMGLPVGILVPHIIGRNLHIKELCTLHRFHRQGVATALVRFITKRAVENGKIRSIVVKVPLNKEHTAAISFFKKRYEFIQSVDDNLMFLDRVSNSKEEPNWCY